MPRHPRHIRRRGSPSARPLRPAADIDPAARLRALVQEGIVAAAAITAREDLDRAVASTQRLGALTSGMWRALSRELATAADRLDSSTVERLDDISRRARTLEVAADDVVAAGLAAAHLDGHRETLETLVPRLDDAHVLIEPNMLFGLSIDDPLLGEHLLEDDDEDDDEPQDDDVAAMSIKMWLFFWPAPLLPASVAIVPSLGADADAGPFQLNVTAPEPLLEALGQSTGFSLERMSQALIALGSACWTAHLQDDQVIDDDDDDDDTDDDDDDLSDEEDQALGVDDASDV